ncbi:hypothetical protein N9D31_03965, partial [Oligoflexaceae bacterium]|nr:hypothetical protein [Oligoflexaceae bacterium]
MPEVNNASSNNTVVGAALVDPNIRYRYNPEVLAFPQAAHAAYETFYGGDFFKLFSPQPSIFFSWPIANEEEALENEFKLYDDYLYKATLQGSSQNTCRFLNGIFSISAQSPVIITYQQYLAGKRLDCRSQPSMSTLDSLITQHRKILNVFVEERKKFLAKDQKYYQSLADYQKIDVPSSSKDPIIKPLSPSTWQALPNSQTNANRKRSAYFLKTYMCDDILPVKLESSEVKNHAKNRHLTDPACATCHYKLDPMGGLFRFHGAGGTDFSNSQVNNGFAFDGGGFLQAREYREFLQTNWPSDINGEVDLGYYKAPNVLHEKWSGNSLEDFWNFLPKAEEVRQCYVQRLTEFIFGEEQAVDRGWLDS